MKTCNRCGREKPPSKYHKRKVSKDGLQHKCKTCTSKHKVWQCMMYRCTNPKSKNYKYYGGRGITVCEEWQTFKGMEPFIEQHWEKGLQLDRIDNNKGYSPDNCRFVTHSVNQRNRRSFGKIKYYGVYFHKSTKKYMAQVWVNDKLTHIGYFTTEIEAAKAYDKYVIENKLGKQLNFGDIS